MASERDIPTEPLTRRRPSLMGHWLPISSVLTVVGVVGMSAATWQGDRSELHAGTAKNAEQSAEEAKHADAITALQIAAAAALAREAEMRRQLDRFQTTLDRIADRVGANTH